MTVAGFTAPALPSPKLTRELRPRIADLLARYSFEDVMTEIARQKSKMDILVSPHGEKRTCPRCGEEMLNARTL